MKKVLLFALLVLTSTLFAGPQVLVFAGSARTESYNKLLAKEAAEMARQEGAEVVLVDLKDFPMPFYEADLEAAEGLPPNAKKLRDLMISSDAVMIASPQFNASLPALLKNVLDWMSRGENGKSSREAYQGKKFALMSASPEKKGGAKGLVHLRQIIEDRRGEVIEEQVSIGFAHLAFDGDGHLKDPESADLLKAQVHALIHGAI